MGSDVLKYISAVDKQLNMVFQFDIVHIGQGPSYKYQFQKWKLPVLKNIVIKWRTFIDGTDVSEPLCKSAHIVQSPIAAN